LTQKDDEIRSLREQKDLATQKQQEALTKLNQEQRDKRKVELELTRYQEEQKIGGNLGGGRLSYAALEEKN